MTQTIRRTFLNTGMLVAVVMPLIIFLMGMIEWGLIPPGKSDADVLSAYAEPMALTNYIQFACVFPALPFAFSYLEEKNSGYIKFIFSRMGREKYIRNKVFMVGLSGGIAAALPSLILFVYLIIVQNPTSMDSSSPYYPALMEGMAWMPYTEIWGGAFVLLLKLILVFLFGIFWAEFTLLISMLVSNRYIVFAVPIAVYLLTWMLLPGKVAIITPIHLLRGDFNDSYPVFMPFVVQLIYIAITAMLILLCFRRKQNHE